MGNKYRKKFKESNELICGICGNYGEIVHHIVPEILRGGDAKKNLIILCEQCHGKLHGHYKHKAQKEAFERNKNFFHDCIMDLAKVAKVLKKYAKRNL